MWLSFYLKTKFYLSETNKENWIIIETYVHKKIGPQRVIFNNNNKKLFRGFKTIAKCKLSNWKVLISISLVQLILHNIRKLSDNERAMRINSPIKMRVTLRQSQSHRPVCVYRNRRCAKVWTCTAPKGLMTETWLTVCWLEMLWASNRWGYWKYLLHRTLLSVGTEVALTGPWVNFHRNELF